jgi:RNA 3'-terminal phosphate cyclase (ATP)
MSKSWIRQLVDGETEGVSQASGEIIFRPGKPAGRRHYAWDIGSAGSTTALALAVLPVLAFGTVPVSVELRGGLFQDFAPSFYHLEQVLLPLLRRMGIEVTARMERPGYVPTGGGIVQLAITRTKDRLRSLTLVESGSVEKVWGIALSSRLKHQSVSDRMAQSAKAAFNTAGYDADLRVVYDDTALQAGAGLALFADLSHGARLGADRAGAPGRRSESIGKYAAARLLEDLKTGATLDRYASDQIIPFAALAFGQSRFRIPHVSDHIRSNIWLAREFLGAEINAEGQEMAVKGVGFQSRSF